MRLRGDTALRGLGLILGLAAAASLVAASRIPAGTGTLGADVIFASGPTGELAVSPTGPFLSATNLTPGVTDASGSLRLTNQTRVDLIVQVRGVPCGSDLEEALQVRVATAEGSLFDGTLGQFRSWSPGTLAFAPGETVDVEVSAGLDANASEGWSGRIANVGVEFRSRPQGESS